MTLPGYVNIRSIMMYGEENRNKNSTLKTKSHYITRLCKRLNSKYNCIWVINAIIIYVYFIYIVRDLDFVKLGRRIEYN